MPRDLFAEANITPTSGPRDLFEEAGIKPTNDVLEGMTGTEKFLAGMGKGFVDIGRGVGERLGMISPEEIAQARELDKPLMETGAGKAGEIAGQLATTLPTMAIPGVGTVRGATALGGALGLLQPTTKEESVAGNVGLGAAGGALGGIAPGIVSRVISPKASQTVSESLGQLTPGQALGGAFKAAEEKMTSLPFAGELVKKAQQESLESWNKGVINKALEPIGESINTAGHEGVAEAGDLISKSYNALLPKLKVQADPEFMQQISSLKELTQSLPPDRASQVDNILQNNILGKFTDAGLMSGETMKQVDSKLGQLIRGYKSSADFDSRQVGDALREAQSALRSMVERNNPEHAGTLSRINDAFSKFIRIERAASGVGAKEGIFTPAQFNTAVKGTDASLRKGRFARGEALMQDVAKQGEKTIGSKYPDSGTAGRFAQMAAGGLYLANPALAAAELATAAAYAHPKARNALVALIAKRPEIASELAQNVRLTSPATGALGAGLGGYLASQ